MKRYSIALIGIMMATLGCNQLGSQYVNAKYDGGMQFIGKRSDEKSPTTYFSVRVKNENDEPITSDCPLVLHWKGNIVPVHSITPEILDAIGVAVASPDYKGPEWKFGFIGGGDQNRDYAIEFHLRNDRLVEFYARHNSSSPCPFQLSSRDQPPVPFPLSESQLETAFGKPKSVTWFTGH